MSFLPDVPADLHASKTKDTLTEYEQWRAQSLYNTCLHKLAEKKFPIWVEATREDSNGWNESLDPRVIQVVADKLRGAGYKVDVVSREVNVYSMDCMAGGYSSTVKRPYVVINQP